VIFIAPLSSVNNFPYLLVCYAKLLFILVLAYPLVFLVSFFSTVIMLKVSLENAS